MGGEKFSPQPEGVDTDLTVSDSIQMSELRSQLNTETDWETVRNLFKRTTIQQMMVLLGEEDKPLISLLVIAKKFGGNHKNLTLYSQILEEHSFPILVRTKHRKKHYSQKYYAISKYHEQDAVGIFCNHFKNLNTSSFASPSNKYDCP